MTARETLFRIYWASRKRIVPSLTFAQDVYEEVLSRHVTPDTTWLDLGCGHRLLPAWRDKEEEQLVASCQSITGLDFSLAALKRHKHIVRRVQGDITHLSFRDECVDLVTANMVVEHLDDPERHFREISRILKPSGMFILHTPNARGYVSILRRLVPDILVHRLVSMLDGRPPEDVFRVHYRANTEERIEELASTCGFQVVKARMIVTDAIFSMVPPLMIFELVWIKALMTKPLEPLRTNIIAVLKKV